jgi:hypothetical protein
MTRTSGAHRQQPFDVERAHEPVCQEHGAPTQPKCEIDDDRVGQFPTANETSRGDRVVAYLRGRGDVALSTDEILALTRSLPRHGGGFIPNAANDLDSPEPRIPCAEMLRSSA